MNWIVLNENQSLSIVNTAGFKPPNAICEAMEGWDARFLTYDPSSGIVFVDPEKVRQDSKPVPRSDHLKLEELKAYLSSMSPYLIYIVVAFAMGYFLGHIH